MRKLIIEWLGLIPAFDPNNSEHRHKGFIVVKEKSKPTIDVKASVVVELKQQYKTTFGGTTFAEVVTDNNNYVFEYEDVDYTQKIKDKKVNDKVTLTNTDLYYLSEWSQWDKGESKIQIAAKIKGLMIKGMSRAEIATQLNGEVSDGYVGNIYSKLQKSTPPI
jgi:hypothetical protein